MNNLNVIPINFYGVKKTVTSPNKNNTDVTNQTRTASAPSHNVWRSTLAGILFSIGAVSYNSGQQNLVPSNWIIGETSADKSVYGLARRFEMSPDEFRKTFDIKDDNLKKGQTFKVPAYTAKKDGVKIADIAKLYNVSPESLAKLNSTETTATLKKGEMIFILPSQKTAPKDVKPTEQAASKKEVKKTSAKKAQVTSDKTKVKTDNGKTWTLSELHADAQATALRKYRPQNRPVPPVKNGKICAEVEVIQPTAKGPLSEKTIIINTGHGYGANGVFDAGACNDIILYESTSKEKAEQFMKTAKGKNGKLIYEYKKSKGGNIYQVIEFKGNRGNALEEWKVNKNFGLELTKKLSKKGAKIIFIAGEVNLAMKEIRRTKADMIISLHSNSAGNETGMQIIYSNRGGIDKKDKHFGEIIQKNLNEHDWFRGANKLKGQSLGVLASSANQSSPIPGILVETGNLKHPKDIANLDSGKFRELFIDKMEESVIDYFK